MDIRIAAYSVIVDGDRILLAHWNERGRSGWTLPGGGIEPGEDPVDAVVREIAEETGFEAETEELLGLDSKVIPAEERFALRSGPLHALRIVYRARVIGGILTNEVGGSTDEAAWFPLDGIPSHRVDLVDAALSMAGLTRG
ncbi:MutT-like domain-containing protein [Leifsonia xyli subsp. cynodontis DSM 46306]|uniref:Nudix hydrolase domain-containing protein n=1 Tax=Leifsonia xyli subsp. cynodontis DSM 46306 TaxID=1389489 RepID=U3P4E4_LEIXC|nr:NUDIX hydrolase [Leifsonia xyli]AGW40299.1 MutT-like domain-containing protein [Leifsonia xyli subsp. cynodontis DSM 46306]